MEREIELAVPQALNMAGELLTPEDATGLAEGQQLRCPTCLDSVHLRTSVLGRLHFVHTKTTDCSGPETELHRAAKQSIAAAIIHSIEGSGAPIYIERTCTRCMKKVNQKIPPRVRNATCEYMLECGRIPDIALLDADGLVIAAIEVRHTHAVGPEKAADLAFAGIPWIEVDAEDERLPFILSPVNDGGLRELTCKCLPIIEHILPDEIIRHREVVRKHYESREVQHAPSNRSDREAKFELQQLPVIRAFYNVHGAPDHGHLQKDEISYSLRCPISQSVIDPTDDCPGCEYFLERITGSLHIRGVPPGGFDGLKGVRCGRASQRTQADFPELKRFFRSMERLLLYECDRFMPQLENQDDDMIWDWNNDNHLGP